jgi:transcription-repair coupling factor (superfamily II helicase)
VSEPTDLSTAPAPVIEAAALEPLPELVSAWKACKPGARLEVGNLWGSAQALVLANLAGQDASMHPMLVATSSEGEAEAFADDLVAFGLNAVRVPARAGAGSRGAGGDVESVRSRLQMAQRLARAQGPDVLVGSLLSLLQPVPGVRDLGREFLTLREGELLDVEALLARLVKAGYVRQPLAEAPGEVSLRGDILDLYAFAADTPVRVELFEDEIESLRTFDPDDQRSIEQHRELEVCLAADAGGIRDGTGVPLFSMLPGGAPLVQVEPLRLGEQTERLRIRSPDHDKHLRALDERSRRGRVLALQSLPGEHLSLDTRSVQGLEVGMRAAPGALREAAAKGERVIVLALNEAEEHRLSQELARAKVSEVELRRGQLSRGFRVPAWGLVIVNHHELKGVLGTRRRAKPQHQHKVRAIQSFFELKRGDLVVHAVHGLARFRGLVRMARGGGEEEHLHLGFADEVSLYVPSSRVDMVQRYIGPGGSQLPLDKIGGSAFRKRKERVERGLFDMAADLIEVQAKRTLHERPTWREDEELVHDLVGSFPYEDTPDQTKADGEIEADLYSKHPMDRMLCGDVGFGKTEMALRAAFRVVNGGGQVALLVPTTVLAQQHEMTFRERLADFPVEVASLSRYVTGKRAKSVIERTARGEIDILVGTHRILSKDVSFKNLGLIIIDEEQRFGVAHKEHFKRVRAEVDVLTLTATPIPRSLHLSLSGLRDISSLSDPPPGRQAIETKVAYCDDDVLVAEVMRRELDRGGQIFFLHNRVSSIDGVAQRLRGLVPDARYVVGHGQMGSRELRQVMDTFTRGDADVLVATTIVENGLDIPAAGTILIDDADHFGLGELHQLRGRVGRGAQKAWCFLLIERNKPLHDVARERLKALEEMSHLGAGFGISIKDLELRGAGNVLGAEQSGHIAAVGYDMFCRLLRLTIERLQSGEELGGIGPRVEEREAGVELELGLAAFLPPEWIPSPDARLAVLRELSGVHSPAEFEAAAASLRDRFGRVPPEAETLLRMFRLKVGLDPHQLLHVAYRDDAYLIQYADRVAFERLVHGLDCEVRRVKGGVAHLMIPPGASDAASALDWLEGLLQLDSDATRMPAGEAR